MTPWAAALSMRFTAARRASAESSAPVSAACTARLTRVLISERAALLRRRRRSFWRLRLIWLLMLATEGPGYTSAAAWPRRHRARAGPRRLQVPGRTVRPLGLQLVAGLGTGAGPRGE